MHHTAVSHSYSLSFMLFPLFCFAEGVLVDQPAEFSKLTSAQMTGAVTNNMRYLAKRGKQVAPPQGWQ